MLAIIEDSIKNKIYIIRDQKVMIDRDLAMLYGVETKRLVEQVKRNKTRFPEDFMFQLSKAEFENLKSQIATSSWGGARKIPHAFTEQGVAMLSSVLSSEKAVQVNITIMRVFIKAKEIGYNYKKLAEKITKIEEGHGKHNKQIQEIFNTLKSLIKLDINKKSKEIGFKVNK